LNAVIVKPGDSLWKLAEQNLGQGLRWHELLAINPNLRNANHIEAGSQILLPTAVSSVRAATTMTVQKDDSLSKIARAHFGHASSWSCIAHANPSIVDANLIFAGQTIVLPATCMP
jgi:nucleoid-associated protein YgaU